MSTTTTNNDDTILKAREQKKALRKKIRTLTKTLTDEEIQTQSQQVWERLYNLPAYKTAKSIGLFLSMPSGEINTDPVLRKALRDGKKLYTPRVGLDFEKCDMDLVPVSTTTTTTTTVTDDKEKDELFYKSWPTNKWGIPEPPIEVTEVAGPGDIDLLVVPGCTFDKVGGRLGQGKGYYDRFIARVRIPDENGNGHKPLLVAVGMTPQILETETVPTLDHDFSMDIVISPEATITL